MLRFIHTCYLIPKMANWQTVAVCDVDVKGSIEGSVVEMK